MKYPFSRIYRYQYRKKQRRRGQLSFCSIPLCGASKRIDMIPRRESAGSFAIKLSDKQNMLI
jgi:hypothetical protein